jgi:uncharacterized protein YeaC (DUF1315 family)
MFKKGYKQTEQQKQKIRQAVLGNKNWLGKKHTAETRLKMSLSAKGKVVSEHTKQLLSKINIGKHHTDESKKKMSLARKGKKFTMEHRKNLGLKGDKNPMWKGGISPIARIKYASRPKTSQCEVCGALGRICYDHDHITGKFRGWLCLRCNFALGYVKDNSETLIALAEYLKNSRLTQI